MKEINLQELEEKLKEAHKKYIAIDDVKSKEYKEARQEYLTLSELYRKEYDKYLKRLTKEN